MTIPVKNIAAALMLVFLTALASHAEEKKDRPVAPPQKVPRGLDDMIAAALRSNPEVLRAEAKVRQAQANLNQARLQIMKEVATAYHEMVRQEAILKSAEQTFSRTRQMVETGTVSQTELWSLEAAVAEAKAKLSQTDAHTRYLLGIGGDVRLPEASLEANVPKSARERPPIPEKYRAALEKKVSMAFDQATGATVLDFLRKQFETNVLTDRAGAAQETTFDLKLSDTTVGDILTALSDLRGFVFVFRDYGILVSDRESAARLNAATFPDIPVKN